MQVNLLEEEDAFDPSKEIGKSHIKEGEPDDPEEIILFIREYDEEIRFGTLGNFSVIKGRAKSKKTFFLTMIAAAALKNGCLDKIKSRGLENKEHIFFDTEQSRNDVKKVRNRVLSLTGDVSKMSFYCLRPYTPKERVEIIDYVLKTASNIGLVIIDGARDLLSDINSQEQGTELVSKYMKWTELYNIHIATVIHENKTDGSARGAIGTELQNKAELVVSVRKNADDFNTSSVVPEYSRGKDFKEFEFEIGNSGIPQVK